MKNIIKEISGPVIAVGVSLISSYFLGTMISNHSWNKMLDDVTSSETHFNWTGHDGTIWRFTPESEFNMYRD